MSNPTPDRTHSPYVRVLIVSGILTLLLLLVPASRARADSIVLQTCNATELINAIIAANAEPDADDIQLNSTCTGANAYLLTTVNNDGGQGPNGLPVITSNLTIEGNDATIARSTANGVPQFRLVQVNPQAILNLNNVTLEGGDAGSGDGGAIYVEGEVQVNGSTLSANNAHQGGGIFVTFPGELTVTTTTFSQNSATQLGGAVAVWSGTNSTITQSTFVGNLLNDGAIGAGLAVVESTATIANSTFFNNNAGGAFGGGIGNSAGTLTLLEVTIAGNSAGAGLGGGIANQGTTLMQNSMVANNSQENCQTINDMDQGNNLDSGTTCGFTASTSLNNANPQLGPLANNGGPTQTMALASNSPAVDAGGFGGCVVEPVDKIDQRGVSRPQGTNCDIGAFELQLSGLTLTACPAPLPAPKLLSPKDKAELTSDHVSLDWQSVRCATRYEIRISSGKRDRLLVDQSPTQSHYTTAALNPGQPHHWQVRACKKKQCSPWSAERTFTFKLQP